jgi:hypothetical protein
MNDSPNHARPTRSSPEIPPDIDFGHVWNRVTGDIWASEPGWVEQTAARLLKSPALARALVTTPSLVLAWLLASVLVFGLGVVVTNMTDQPWVPFLAPIVAIVGVSFVYGAGADPAWEIMRTMALPQRMVLLVRVTAVFSTNVVIALAAALFTDVAGPIVMLWLLPMVALSMIALAFATWTQSPMFGAASGLLIWFTVALQSLARSREVTTFVTQDVITGMAPLYVAATMIAGVVIVLGSGGLPGRDRWEPMRWS